MIATFVCRHGSPVKILSDQGSNSKSVLDKELFELLDKERLGTTPFTPECDGLSERDNRTNKAALTSSVNEQTDYWDKFIPFIQFAYNTKIYEY
jgi:hypothetical protein